MIRTLTAITLLTLPSGALAMGMFGQDPAPDAQEVYESQMLGHWRDADGGKCREEADAWTFNAETVEMRGETMDITEVATTEDGWSLTLVPAEGGGDPQTLSFTEVGDVMEVEGLPETTKLSICTFGSGYQHD
ncbi:MAG: hypothetical protein ACU0CI_11440 [Shimia sp.]